MLSRMTVDEKIDQMLSTDDLNEAERQIKNRENPVIFGNAVMFKNVKTATIRRVEKYLKNNMRLYIPLLVIGESLHGVMNPDATVFPQSIGLGSTFNEDLVENIADVIGAEARSLGICQVLAPNLDLAREPRWGRTEEDFGEDPYLVSRMGAAYIAGIQKNKVAATAKHYIAHGSPEGGLNIAPVHMGERELRESILEPFREAVCNAGVMAIMPAYSEFDGIPLHASEFLLRKLLRGELGFEGVVISDFEGIRFLHDTHRTARGALAAGMQALNSGIDVEAPYPYGYGEEFRKAAVDGRADMKLIDEAVSRILTLKFKLGLFDREETDDSPVHTAESVALSKRAAKESIILLKNDGVLPFGKDVKKIAVIGPNADEAQLGDYSVYDNATHVTPKMAFERRFGKNNIIYAKGSGICRTDKRLLAKAETAAGNSDVAVLILGDSSKFFGGIGWGDKSGDAAVTCGEGFDVAELYLPAAQRLLFERIRRVGKPVVLILNTGRPYCVGTECDGSAAVVQAWYLGERGGEALVEILAGDDCPSGKLPVSFPRSSGHLPCYYNYKPSARGYYKKPGTADNPGRDYVFGNPSALFEFGYGLSYTSFEYFGLKADISRGTDVTVTVNVKNTGGRDAYESVLLFVSAEYCPVTPAVRRLRGFKKIYLKKGRETEVVFELTAEDFSYVAEDMKTRLCTGRHLIAVGKLGCFVDIAE